MSSKWQVLIQLDAENVHKTAVRLKGDEDDQWTKLTKVINQRFPTDDDKYSLSTFGIVLQIKNEDSYLLSDKQRLHSLVISNFCRS